MNANGVRALTVSMIFVLCAPLSTRAQDTRAVKFRMDVIESQPTPELKLEQSYSFLTSMFRSEDKKLQATAMSLWHRALGWCRELPDFQECLTKLSDLAYLAQNEDNFYFFTTTEALIKVGAYSAVYPNLKKFIASLKRANDEPTLAIHLHALAGNIEQRWHDFVAADKSFKEASKLIGAHAGAPGQLKDWVSGGIIRTATEMGDLETAEKLFVQRINIKETACEEVNFDFIVGVLYMDYVNQLIAKKDFARAKKFADSCITRLKPLLKNRPEPFKWADYNHGLALGLAGELEAGKAKLESFRKNLDNTALVDIAVYRLTDACIQLKAGKSEGLSELKALSKTFSAKGAAAVYGAQLPKLVKYLIDQKEGRKIDSKSALGYTTKWLACIP